MLDGDWDVYIGISIHAPRVGSDLGVAADGVAGHDISIPAPRVGSDPATLYPSRVIWLFQSTLPVWGATGVLFVHQLKDPVISIHAPRVGSDNR